MKNSYFIFGFIILSSCNGEMNNSGDSNRSEFPKIFTSNTSSIKMHHTMTIKYEGNNVLAKRGEGLLKADEESNRFYIESKNISFNYDGAFELLDPHKKVWFIPFQIGASAHDLNSTTRCFRYYCNCGGLPGPSDPFCGSVQELGALRCRPTDSQPNCPNPDQICTGSAAWIACNTEITDGNIVEYFQGGGVFLDADNVRVIDPDYYKPNPNGQVDFIIKDNNMYLKSDIEKMEKESKTNKD